MCSGKVYNQFPNGRLTNYRFTPHKTAAGALWSGIRARYAPIGSILYAVSAEDFRGPAAPLSVVWLNYTKASVADSGLLYFADTGNQVALPYPRARKAITLGPTNAAAGGKKRGRISAAQILCEIVVRNFPRFLSTFTGIPQAVPLLTCTMPADLGDDV